MKRRFMLPALLIILLFSLSASVSAPDEKAEKPAKNLTAKDKDVIKEIFKTIGITQYRMGFENNETYGSYQLHAEVVKALKTGSSIDADFATGDLYKSYQPDLAFWYYIDKSSSEGLEGVFGKAKTARLNAIINKYTVATK